MGVMVERLIELDGRYFGGLFAFFYRAIRPRLLLAIAAALVAMIIAYVLTPRPVSIYGAKASVRLGRLAGSEIMSTNATVALVNSLSFKQRLLQSINLPEKDDRAVRVISDSLRAVLDTSDTIVIEVSALEEQQARDAIGAVVPLLNDEQDRMRQPVLNDINAQIAETKEDISEIKQIQQNIRALIGTPSPAASSSDVGKGADQAQLFDTLSRNEQSLVNLRASLRDLISRATPEKTYKAAVVGDIVVSPAPLSPRSSRVAILAGLLTFVGFLLYGLLRQPQPS